MKIRLRVSNPIIFALNIFEQHALYGRRIIIGLLTLGSACLTNAQPVVTVSPGADCVRLDHVGFRFCNLPSVETTKLIEGPTAVGRTYGRLSVTGISFPEASSLAPMDAETRRGGHFDAWNLFTDAAEERRHAVLLEFQIDGSPAKECFLSIGFNQYGIVFVDHKAVWGVGCHREHIPGQNIIPIPLTNGRALVDVLLWRAEPWTSVPQDHFAQEWEVGLGLCPTLDSAWKTYLSNNYHFMDSPIVKSPADLRFEVNLLGHEDVKIMDLKGEVVITGKVTSESTLSLTSPKENLPSPFVGLISLGGEVAEAVLFEGDSSLDAISEKVLGAGTRQAADWPAWKFRCEHLLKPQFVKDRDQWWARKFALSLAMAGLQTRFDQTSSPFHNWKAAGLELRSYKSEIDGVTQHYRAMIGPPKDGHSRPLAIFLPGAPIPVRPFLESYTIADMRETTELLARLAEHCGVDLLWPGDVDIDYGGTFARRWVKESLDALQAEFPAVGYRPVYIVGTCAAGVAALGFAKTYGGIDGIVCWSPIVSRNAYRWPIRDENWPVMLPAETLAAEATDVDPARLKSTPVFCIFDHNVAGHGDREGTKRFCDSLSRLGGTVVQRWIPYPDPVLEWGPRAAESEMEWLNWIAWNSSKNGPKCPPQTLSPPQTIKDALLVGFTVDQPSSESGRAWLARWKATMAQYRGAEPDISRGGKLTQVRIEAVSRDVAQSRFFGDGSPGRPLRTNIANWPEVLASYSDLWIVELATGSPCVVDIQYRSSGDSSPIPTFDLFREGGCRRVAWGFRNGGWELLQVWL